jgi:hypothetical protein
MRVRVTAQGVRAYWEYAVREFKQGEELLGDLARHLLANAPEGSVEVLEHDPEPEKPAPPVDPVEGADPADSGDEPPTEGTIETLMAWVGDDPERAARALAAEQGRDKPRATVLKRLGGTAE